MCRRLNWTSGMGKKCSHQALKPGDVVRVVWKDHYTSGASTFPAPEAMLAESFGRVKALTEDGLAIYQNRIINAETFERMSENMDGLFILIPVIVEIEKLS